jgi:hypothetical protein
MSEWVWPPSSKTLHLTAPRSSTLGGAKMRVGLAAAVSACLFSVAAQWTAHAADSAPTAVVADPVAVDACLTSDGGIKVDTFVCLGSDLVDASYFAKGGGAPPNDAEAANLETSAPPPDDDSEDIEELSDEPPSSTPTAMIVKDLVWTIETTTALQADGRLEIPVCWRNPADDDNDRAGRTRTEAAVKATWEQHADVRFTGWSLCDPDDRGGIRIQIADEGPRALVGSAADDEDIGMFLNFTFKKWSVDCQQPAAGQSETAADPITWDHCVYSIAVHEFGHALGFMHEHDRLFFGKDFHALEADDFAVALEACRTAGTYRASTGQPSADDVWTTDYDPRSVMNYCFNIYDHDVALSSKDVELLKKAYPSIE